MGSGTTTGGRWVAPSGSQATATPLAPIQMEVSWRANPVVIVEGKRLVIRAVTATSITYEVE